MTALAISDASVPLQPVAAGSVLSLEVTVTTEDGEALPRADAHQGLTLTIISPCSSNKNGKVCCFVVGSGILMMHKVFLVKHEGLGCVSQSYYRTWLCLHTYIRMLFPCQTYVEDIP
jgi:hypothetical protein